jgi:RNA polymerase sigma-70 factor, ECF subfamily
MPQTSMETLECYRNLLRMLASLGCSESLQSKIDLSGVVNQTLYEAHMDKTDWQSWEEHQITEWLGKILSNNLKDEINKFTTKGRDVSREVPIHKFDESATGIEAWLASQGSTPSQRASKNEELIRLANALAKLPEKNRRVIELHHLRQLSIDKTAEILDETRQSVVGLLYRGMIQLRKIMGVVPDGD